MSTHGKVEKKMSKMQTYFCEIRYIPIAFPKFGEIYVASLFHLIMNRMSFKINIICTLNKKLFRQ